MNRHSHNCRLQASGLFCLICLIFVVTPGHSDPQASPADAEEFVELAEATLLERAVDSERASWVQQNFITEDTELLAAQAYDRYIAAVMELAKESTRFDGLALSQDLARRVKMLKLILTLPAPSDPELRAELTRIAASLESTYGKGKYCRSTDDCQDLGDLTRLMARSRDAEKLLEAWVGWRTISPPMREDYRRFVELGNQGARALGFADLGVMWQSKYDMPAESFTAEVERLWAQVEPFYISLHCYVRGKLNDFYGDDVVPADDPIPAHLLGNMWAQSWENIYPLVAPEGSDPGFDLTARLEQSGLDAIEMVRIGEKFFASLGFEPLPETFWERSLFTKPPDREVMCHPSAWNIDQVDDLRIKMCIEPTAEDFATIHHELGHNFYQRAYNIQSPLFRSGAHDGFHEGVGDTLSLSVTPQYLVEIGLLDGEPDSSGDLGLLLRSALEKIAFLPFAFLVDQWRWQVFSGEIPADRYNQAWWELRERYQGVRPPVERGEADFDPGAKYHIPANTPYTRYFLAHILQYQFHRSLCETAAHDGPLHRCSIYGNTDAGERLERMLEMGSSRPWPDALEAVSGERQMEASAILDYFAPLKDWLAEQNRGELCGW